MKGIVNIQFSSKLQSKLDYSIYKDIFNYKLKITINPDENFTNLSDKEQIIRNRILDGKMDEFVSKKMKRGAKSQFDFIRNAEYFMLGENIEETITYIKHNPELKYKKIILPGKFGIDKEEYQTIKKQIEPIKDMDIYVFAEGNDEMVSLKDYEKTIRVIDQIAEHIKTYDYSPFEMLLHTYDIVRGRFYIEEDNHYTESRDLTKVLFSDKIVCAGFSKIFDAVIKKLGFKSALYTLHAKNSAVGHMNNLVYVQDEKYGIDGFYYFDVTWGCKKTGERREQDYLLSYRTFAKTKQQMEEYYLDLFEDRNITVDPYDLPELIEGDSNCYDEKQNVLGTMNFLSKVLYGKEKIFVSFSKDHPITKEEELLEDAYKFSDLLNDPIAIDAFLEALVTVRRNEYYENEKQYPFDMFSISGALNLSDFVFKDTQKDKMALIFPELKENIPGREDKKLKEYDEKYGLQQNIQRTKVAKVLQKVYEKKANE